MALMGSYLEGVDGLDGVLAAAEHLSDEVGVGNVHLGLLSAACARHS